MPVRCERASAAEEGERCGVLLASRIHSRSSWPKHAARASLRALSPRSALSTLTTSGNRGLRAAVRPRVNLRESARSTVFFNTNLTTTKPL